MSTDPPPTNACAFYMRVVAFAGAQELEDALFAYLEECPGDLAWTVLQLVLLDVPPIRLHARLYSILSPYGLEGVAHSLIETIRRNAYLSTQLPGSRRLSRFLLYMGCTYSLQPGERGTSDVREKTKTRFANFVAISNLEFTTFRIPALLTEFQKDSLEVRHNPDVFRRRSASSSHCVAAHASMWQPAVFCLHTGKHRVCTEYSPLSIPPCPSALPRPPTMCRMS
ncbi:hypothetical protein C8F01DRAFT_495786 [Mycena amicta]|nr:hypothetical protein C8F01DRAFT_495786 [Mycena amicta]